LPVSPWTLCGNGVSGTTTLHLITHSRQRPVVWGFWITQGHWHCHHTRAMQRQHRHLQSRKCQVTQCTHKRYGRRNEFQGICTDHHQWDKDHDAVAVEIEIHESLCELWLLKLQVKRWHVRVRTVLYGDNDNNICMNQQSLLSQPQRCQFSAFHSIRGNTKQLYHAYMELLCYVLWQAP